MAKAGRCSERGRGRYDRGYIYLRITKDTCADNVLRVRIWEECVASFHAGNWVNDVRQLSSTDCSPNVADNFGYEWQVRHGKVHQKSLDNGVAARTMASTPKVQGPKWVNQKLCGTVVLPQDCYIGYAPRSHSFYNEELDGTPLFRAVKHCIKKGAWCEEIVPNGRCMTVNKAVKGVRTISGLPCGSRSRSHKLINAQLWHIVHFSDGTSAFEVYSLSSLDACHTRTTKFQPVLSATGQGARLRMLGGQGSQCTLTLTQLWGPPPPIPAAN